MKSYPPRRKRISRRGFIGGLFASAAMAGLYTWRVEPAWVEFVRRELPVAGLPEGWAGRTLVQLSDLHVGPRVDDDFLRGVFRQVSALRPDLVAYTGDFISYRGERTIAQLRRIAGEMPLGRVGTVAVLGNHDHGDGWRQPEVADAVSTVLRGAGLTVLRNAAAECAGLRVAGLEDLWSGRLSFGALAGGPRPHFVLSHNPDACDLEGWGDFGGWVLAGHTHGGQCKPPFLPPPLLPVKNRRYTSGEFELSGGRRLYINRGLGHLLRVRFNVRPEVTVFRLATRP